MSDWESATDPVPMKRQRDLTDDQRVKRLRVIRRRRDLGLGGYLQRNEDTVSSFSVESDFDDMGA